MWYIKKFSLRKVKGGLHPVIMVTMNGQRVRALVDTGANITCHGTKVDGVVHGTLDIAGLIVGVTMPRFKIPGGYKLLIGSDILAKTNALIDYKRKEITLMR